MSANTLDKTKTGHPAASLVRDGARPGYPQVLQLLETFCAGMSFGERVPTHTELMRRFGASERMVLRALDELQRTGRVVRRHGSGTFIAEPGATGEASRISSPVLVSDARTIVALAAPDKAFFDRAMELLYRKGEAEGLSLLCRLVEPRQDGTLPTFSLPQHAQEHPLGFIVFHYKLAPLAEQLQRMGCRVVLVGAPPPQSVPPFPCVYGDHAEGGYLAARFLIEQGHRRLACRIPNEPTLRQQGIERAIREANRQGMTVTLHCSNETEREEWGRNPRQAASFLRRRDGPTAILAWNDHDAAGLVGLLAREGVRVPDEVSVIGYDALPEGERMHPRLTTVDQAIDRQLSAALELLTRLETPVTPHNVIVLPRLIIHESSAPPPSS